MLTVNYNASHVQHHPALNSFTAEASELGLTPGEWPDFITVLRDGTAEGVLFQRGARDANDSVAYWANGGVLLTVFND